MTTDSDRFPGVPYPLAPDPKGYYHKEGGTAQIKSDLLILLLTNPKERVMLPDFGTDLRSLFFEPNDAILRQKARQMIIDSINKWEPRIAVQDIQVLTSFSEELDPADDPNSAEHILFIKISFTDPNNIQQLEVLQLEVPLQGL